MSDFTPTVPFSVRIPPKMRDQFDELAEATGRTKSFLAAQAIEQYIVEQTWQVKAIKTSLEKALKKDAKFHDHDDVVKWMKSWGTKNKLERP